MLDKLVKFINPTQCSVYDTESLTIIESVGKIIEKVNLCIEEFNNLEVKTTNDYNNFIEQINEYKKYIENLFNENLKENTLFKQEFRELIYQLNNLGFTLEYIKTQSKFVQDLAKYNQDQIDKGTVATVDQINDIKNNLSNRVNVMNMFNCKGDGVTDDYENLKKAITYCQNNKRTLYFPSGYKFAVSQPIVITKRIDIEGLGSEIIALNEMGTLFTIDEEILYDESGTDLVNRLDLYDICNMSLPKINGNDKVNNGFHLKRGVKINFDNLNIVKCKINSFIQEGTVECFIERINIYCTPSKNSVGILSRANDCVINNINMIDAHTGIKTKGVNMYNNVHAWILTEDILEGSTFFEMFENKVLTNRISQCYADTYQIIFKSDNLKQNVQVSQLFVIYNNDIYPSEGLDQYLFYANFENNDYAFNWSSIVNSYIQGSSWRSRIHLSNTKICNVKLGSESFYVNTKGIKDVTNNSIKLNDGITINKRNNIIRDNGNVNITLSLKIDCTVTGRKDKAIKIGYIPKEIMLPYERQQFIIFCSENDNTDLPTNSIPTICQIEGFSPSEEYKGLITMRIPEELIASDTIYIVGSHSFINRQYSNSALDYSNDNIYEEE